MFRPVYLASAAMLTLTLAACGNGSGSSGTATQGGSSSGTTMASNTQGSATITTTMTTTTNGGSGTTTSMSTSSGGGSTGGCTPQDQCVMDSDCSAGQTCVSCICTGTSVCDAWGMDGMYADCIMNGNGACMNPNAICVVDDTSMPHQGVCLFEGCTDNCDCPQPPMGFESQVTCDNVTGNGMECFISCANGASCPDGMSCLGGQLCVFGMPPMPTSVPPYGDCQDVMQPAQCDNMGICLVDSTTAPTWSFCSEPCMSASDCTTPDTGNATVACVMATNMGMNCVLNCGGGATCPDGMECFNNQICEWPVQMPGYGDCENNPANMSCVGMEVCYNDSSQSPETGVCTAPCTMPSDCPPAPATGDAPIACGDIGQGSNSCYLDCSSGQTCPDNAVCVNNDHCMFPMN